MMSMEGTVIIVQESRFQLLDRNGVGHHFLLGHAAAPEPQQLWSLQRDQSRVRVDYDPAPDVLAHLARRITLLDGA